MIYLHEISDVWAAAMPQQSPGIHYAAKKISNPELLMKEVARVLLDAVLHDHPPAGMAHGVIDPKTIEGTYDTTECSVLFDKGYNPIRLMPGRNPVLYGQQFVMDGRRALIYGPNGIYPRSTPCLTSRFKMLLFSAAMGQNRLCTPVALATDDSAVTPLHRAIRAAPPQVGFFIPGR